jgi:hypothetical protein
MCPILLIPQSGSPTGINAGVAPGTARPGARNFLFLHFNSFNASLIYVIIKLALACFTNGLYSP